MAYVGEPFVYDIFVTYSHGDPEGTGTSKIRQWSQGFARELESELKAYPEYAHDLKIFLDQHPQPSQGLEPTAPLTDQLRSDIQGAALLTVLMSPHYLGSSWCRQERDWWSEKQRDSGLPIDGRIFVVRIWPTDESTWPGDFADRRRNPLIGFCFYDKEHAAHTPQPFGWAEPGPTTGNPFRAEMLNLVGWLNEKLKETRQRMMDRRGRAEQMAKLAAGSGQVIYLHGRSEYKNDWDLAADALNSSGFVVFPQEPDPIVNDAESLQKIRSRRIETLADCDALLLVGTEDGRAVDADLVVVGRHDRQSARAISNRLLPCALLDRIGDPIAIPKRKTAARRLEVDWIDATREPWTPAVQQWLHVTARAEAPL